MLPYVGCGVGCCVLHLLWRWGAWFCFCNIAWDVRAIYRASGLLPATLLILKPNIKNDFKSVDFRVLDLQVENTTPLSEGVGEGGVSAGAATIAPARSRGLVG